MFITIYNLYWILLQFLIICTLCKYFFCTKIMIFQAVDVIGKAGTPKTIAGSHTHTTPVLLSFGERAELATDEYIPLSPVMEGFVILKKNEDSVMASVQWT